MAKYTPKGSQATKPQRLACHDRILAGNPYSRRNVDERHLTEIPGPVSELECPERPAAGWEKRGLPDGRFWWFHPEYAVRARMWEFQIRQQSATEQYNREVFSDPRIKD